MMRTAMTGAVLAFALALSGCATEEPAGTGAAESASAAADLLAANGLAGLDAAGVIDRLDPLPVAERPSDLMASVEPDRLVLTDPSGEATLPLPEESTYVSIAPYATQTHDCFYHSLTTCLGEMGNESVDVRIVDDATGEVLVEESATTFDNGFIGFWLPKDVDGTIEMSAGGRTGSTTFSTQPDGATCITDLKLS